MEDSGQRIIISGGLVIGAVLGLAGSFAPTAALRGLAWGIDGTALIIATVLLALRYFRQGSDLQAAGFLVFALGETLILSGTPMDLAAASPSFGTGAGLWAAGLALVSASRGLPTVLRILGLISAALFAFVALAICTGQHLTPLSTPLPFNAYPLLVATLLGWAWVHARG